MIGLRKKKHGFKMTKMADVVQSLTAFISLRFSKLADFFAS